jgi:hypothetical protein
MGLLSDSERFGQGCCSTVVIKSGYIFFTGLCCGFNLRCSKDFDCVRRLEQSHNLTFEAIARCSPWSAHVVAANPQFGITLNAGKG